MFLVSLHPFNCGHGDKVTVCVCVCVCFLRIHMCTCMQRYGVRELFISTSLTNTNQTQVIELQCVYLVSVCEPLCKCVCRALSWTNELTLEVFF